MGRTAFGLTAALWLAAMGTGAEAATLVDDQCGAVISSHVITASALQFDTRSDQYVPLPGARLVLNVPAGQHRCVKVTFTAMETCTLRGDDRCFVELLDNGSPSMRPAVEIAFSPSNQFPTPRSFEWVKRIGPGTHTIVLKGRVETEGSEFHIDVFTMDVELTK